MNRSLISILLYVVLVLNLSGQTNLVSIEGEVTYISSQNVYAKFENTNEFNVGDTLFLKQKNTFLPAVIIEYLSSISIAGRKLGELNIRLGDKLTSFFITTIKHEAEIVTVPLVSDQVVVNELKEIDSRSNLKNKSGTIQGRLSVSSYANFSSTNATDYITWRYTFSAISQNFNASKLSFDSYVSFNYRSTEWNYIKNNLNDALKIYSLAINYAISDKLDLTFGRKINRNLANIGAVDGLQLQGRFNKITAGVIAGSRPDFRDYSYNFKLFEFGGFISHADKVGYGFMQNSLAVFQQTNDFKTDRRFLYFQHNSNLIKQIYLFLSTEVDLYKKVNGEPLNSFSLIGMYASLKYQPIREISFSGSFDSRKNVIYYETYQNYADSIYENATRQGLNFRVNLRPWNNLYFRFSYGNRFRTGDLHSSENYSGNISYTRVPLIRGTISGNYNNLVTSYLSGKIFGLSYSRDIFSGLIYTTLNFRKIKYEFLNGSPVLDQTIIAADMNWRIIRNLSASISYEGTFEQEFSYSRIYFNLTKRF